MHKTDWVCHPSESKMSHQLFHQLLYKSLISSINKIINLIIQINIDRSYNAEEQCKQEKIYQIALYIHCVNNFIEQKWVKRNKVTEQCKQIQGFTIMVHREMHV